MSLENRVYFPTQTKSEVDNSTKKLVNINNLLPVDFVARVPLKNFVDIEINFDQSVFEVLSPSHEINNLTDLHLINTRIWINELKIKYNDQALTLSKVPKLEWEDLFKKYNSFWFMGMYQPSDASRQHCKKWPGSVLYAKNDVNPDTDIVASPFAIPDYLPNKNIVQDWKEWDLVVDFLHENNKKVILDFVPNHVALDHPWSYSHPEYFIRGEEYQYHQNPSLYYSVVASDNQTYYYAHGKDPNYPQWADTLQLNYANPELQNAMECILLGDDNKDGLMSHCDGIRCDMAMLLNPETFVRTWGYRNYGGHLTSDEINYIYNNEFWNKIIPEVKRKSLEEKDSDFIFIAEAYWDFDKLGQNFDVLYGKNFYDDLVSLTHENSKITPDDIKNHINYLINGRKDGKRPYKLALFTENHDEERSICKFGKEASMATAVITAFIPDNIFLINQGQDKGFKIRPPMQLDQPISTDIVDSNIKSFYNRLLQLKNSVLFQEGNWSVMPPGYTEDPYIITQKVVLENSKITALVCTNISNRTSYSHIREINRDSKVKVSSITKDVDIQNFDKDRNGGLFLKLDPWESQVIIYR